MEISRQELIRRLSEDYAEKAKRLSLKFEDAYEQYSKRCNNRSYNNLLHQFTIGNLSTSTGNQTIRVPSRIEEHWVTTNDNDCEDGVCKL